MKLIIFSWLILFFIATVLLGQTFRLQIVEGREQSQRASQNRFRIETLLPQRGVFYDRLGIPLVQNSPHRHYAYPEAFAHLLGYRGEADEKELVLFGVEPGEWVGKTGLERSENSRLRGQLGGALQEFSATNDLIRTLSQSEPISGRSLLLTVDSGLQRFTYELLKNLPYKGVVIVSTPDGQIVTLVSVPSFNPNLFEALKTTPASQAAQLKTELDKLFNDTAFPLFNRAIAGLYPPASTFKMVTALAALDSRAIDEKTTVDDTGELRVGTFRYGNWYYDQYGRTEGLMDLKKAIRRSNDIYFYKVGADTGIENLSIWANTMGFGKLTGIPLIGEAEGLVPNPEWKRATMNEDWFLGDTYITAIGQGNLQTTPIQVHQVMMAMANRGYLCPPKLVLAALDKGPAEYLENKNQDFSQCQNLKLNADHRNLIVQGLQQACEPGGTGWPLFQFKVKNEKLKVEGKIDGINYIEEASGSAKAVRVPVACKTGTAETGRSVFENKKEKHLTHAWFTAFAPVEKPEVVVTVLLEDAGQGSDKAGPIAREILKYWFEQNL